MKYYINYTKDGKILGFTKSDMDLNIEVSNAIWFEGQGYNKIIIDGENISFDKVDWRTQAEIDTDTALINKQEALTYLNSTDWYITRKLETGVEIPLDVSTKRAEARLLA
jgi:hypothetical protein